MPITEQQRQERKRFLGSSDVAAVLGIDEYRTPYDVWADKCGLIEPTGREPHNDAMEVGNACEDAVLNWFGKKKGLTLILQDDTGRNRRLHSNGIMAANIDAFIVGDDTRACEAKTHGVISLHLSEQWGEEGTDEVPERVALQCQHQMAVVPSLKIVHVPVLLGGVGLRAYFVERNDALIKDMTDVMVGFWNDCVLKNVPPPDAVASLETVKRLRRVPNKTVPIADSTMTEWRAAKEELKAAEDKKAEKEILLFSALGDAECGVSEIGSVTYYLRERKEYLVKASAYRQLVFSKPKKGK